MADIKYVCPQCGYEAEAAGTCPYCGSVLVASCAACGNPVVGEQIRIEA